MSNGPNQVLKRRAAQAARIIQTPLPCGGGFARQHIIFNDKPQKHFAS